MAAAVGSDIDSFIREQKAKLATERQALNDVDDSRSAVDVGRRHWDKSGGRDATLAVQETRPQTQEGGLPLTNTGSALKQQALAAQRRQEYNQFLGEKESREGGRRQRRPVTPADAVGLPVGDYQRNRKALDEQRHKEYQEYLQQKQGRQPVDGHGGGGGGSHQHDYKQTSMQLAQQRRQEYNDMLAAKEREPKGVVVEDEITNPSIIPFNRVEEDRIKKRLMEEERQREYQQMKAKLDERHTRGRREASDTGHEGLPVGQYERSRLKEREQQEYREKLEQQVAEKRRLQLQQYDAPTSETAPWKPQLDKDFSKRQREATFVKDAQPENDTRDVPRLGLASTSPRQPSQPGAQVYNNILRVKSPEHLGLPLGGYEETRARLRKERHQDYLRYLASKLKPSPRVHSPTPAPAPRATDTRSYDSQYPGSKPKGAGVDLEATVRRAEKKIEELDYRDLWKEMHGTSQAVNAESTDQKPRKMKEDPQSSTNVYEQQKKKLQAERRQEMQTFLQQQKEEHHEQGVRRQWNEPREGKAVPDSEDSREAARKRLADDRKREYQEMRDKSAGRGKLGRREWEIPETASAEHPLQLGQYERTHQQLQKERQEDYNKMLQSQNPGNRSWREPSQEKLLPLGKNEGKRKELEAERNREYNEYLKSKHSSNRTWREPSAENVLPLGDYDQKRRMIEEEQKREYQEFLKKQNTDRRSLVHQTDEYKASNFPGMNESDNAKVYDKSSSSLLKRDKFVDIKPYSLQKERERNNEYNQFLQEKNKGRRARFPEDKDTDSEYFATLPGLRDSHSAKRRQEQQRNREYNQYLASKMLPARDGDGRPPPAPRKGWATPTYEEMLDKKRHQEAQYRRTNDPNYGQALESDRKLSELDKELEAKKARFRNERLSQGVLDDPTWLSPRRGQNDVKYEELLSRLQDFNKTLKQPRREAPRGDQAYYATLPIGAHVSDSAKRRQKEQYRVDLEQQMREAADGRRREKKMDLSVNYTGYKDPEERVAPVIPVSNRGRQPVVQPYHSKILDGLEKVDQISPRSEVVLGRRRLEDFDRLGGAGGILGAPISLSRAPTRGGGVGLLDNGFESLLEPPRVSALAPPPGLEYQPASYITQGAGGLGQSSVDEAYNFYATRNPLEDVGPAHGGDGGGGGGSVRGRPSQANQELSFAVGGGGGGGRSRVRFDDQGSRQAGQMDFPTDDDKKRQAQQKAQLYQEELNRQIEEKKRKKILEKEEKERYERKLEREAQEYNPFGRGGGGAPMRDAHGNLITDLRLMHKDNDNPDSPRKAALSYRSPRGPAASTVRDDLIGPPPVQTTAEGEQSHARGGHGIFGMPKTDAEKVAADRYKEDLRRQIEERKMEEIRRKEQERLEEEREQRRVEEQQRRMQAEYEEERRKIKEKEEEARRKNDELVRMAEERKREAEERRQAAEERQREEERKEKEAEFNARLAEARGGSPPVPAARTRAADEPLPSTSKEEPVPVSRAQSADVLNQLAAMRQQLQNERQRVENMLKTEKNEPDVFDPRLVQRPPPAPVVKPEIDVFETALNRNAVAVRRTPADRANSQAMDDFTSLKHKGNTDSRKEFLRLFPDQPSSSDTLEAQQAALLRQQERNLQALRQQRKTRPGEYDSGYPKASVPSPSPLTQSRTPQQLHSDSAFVDVDSVNYFPDDFDDIPSNRRNESARARRRNRRDSSPRVTSQGYNDPFGSSTSLNVDRLAKKNEDRLRRLRELQGDDMSLYDPDDVLDRFMSKQAHNRRGGARRW